VKSYPKCERGFVKLLASCSICTNLAASTAVEYSDINTGERHWLLRISEWREQSHDDAPPPRGSSFLITRSEVGVRRCMTRRTVRCRLSPACSGRYSLVLPNASGFPEGVRHKQLAGRFSQNWVLGRLGLRGARSGCALRKHEGGDSSLIATPTDQKVDSSGVNRSWAVAATNPGAALGGSLSSPGHPGLHLCHINTP